MTHPYLRDFPVLCCSNGIRLMHLADTVCGGSVGEEFFCKPQRSALPSSISDHQPAQLFTIILYHTTPHHTTPRHATPHHTTPHLHDRLLFCRAYILPEDLEHFLEPEKAQQAFDILDVDGDGQVTLHNIRDAVVTIYQVNKALVILMQASQTLTYNACNVLAALCITRHCLSACKR